MTTQQEQAKKALEIIAAARVTFADQPETLAKLDECERDALAILNG